jgi:hypothetical protein
MAAGGEQQRHQDGQPPEGFWERVRKGGLKVLNWMTFHDSRLADKLMKIQDYSGRMARAFMDWSGRVNAAWLKDRLEQVKTGIAGWNK